MTKVFLSYSRANEAMAERLYRSLRDRGLDVWFDKESLLPGQVWEEVIKNEIAVSDFVVLLLSKISVGKRGFFQKELRLALEVLDTVPFGHVYLLPARIDDCDIPPRLSIIHCLDLFPSWEKSVTRLCQAIESQKKIQARARAAEADQDVRQNLRLLLVNDQPGIMNFATDLWKSCGIAVDYAFDVPQAIEAIARRPYDVIVSDLSHFSSGRLVTDRAAFEILEWVRDTNGVVKLIIATGDISKERVQLARDLGAIGICNTLPELNALVTEAMGVVIDQPQKLRRSRGKTPISTSDGCRTFIACSQADYSFVLPLVRKLRKLGIDCCFESPPDGMQWERPIAPLIRVADSVIAVVSASSVKSTWFERELYEAIRRKASLKEARIVPVVIDDEGVKNMPYFLRTQQYVDFRTDYKAGLSKVVEAITGGR